MFVIARNSFTYNMFPTKRPYEFKDTITVEFLQSSYTNHQEIAEELALSEIHSLELAMPRFNTVASLNKFEFNKLMSNIKRKFKDTQGFTVMVAAICDTFTCLIQNNKFYDNFAGDNRHGLELMISLLQTIKLLLVTYRKGIETTQLETLIEILEKSAERIQNETEHYDIMHQIILSLKNHRQDLLNKENEKDVQNQNTVTDSQIEHTVARKILNGDRINENSKLPLSNTLSDKKIPNNYATSNMNCESNCISTTEDKKSLCKSGQQAPHVVPLKPQVNNKRPTNAFEFMMMSSKKLALKKKRSI